jgi:hypothetical protein
MPNFRRPPGNLQALASAISARDGIEPYPRLANFMQTLAVSMDAAATRDPYPKLLGIAQRLAIAHHTMPTTGALSAAH